MAKLLRPSWLFLHLSTPETQADGKIVIGGQFTAIDNVARSNIARLNIDGSVDLSWNPVANDYIKALAVSGDTVYAAGLFFLIGGQYRQFIGAVDVHTGLATPFELDPELFVTLSAMRVSGNTLFVAGEFAESGSIGPTSGPLTSGIAALDATTGQAITWGSGADGINPADGYVDALAISGNTLYAAGSFSAIGGQPRSGIAALDATTGMATAFNAMGQSNIFSFDDLAIHDNTLYTTGSFDSVGGQYRIDVAALDATTGLATAWSPSAESSNLDGVSSPGLSAIAVAGSTVYVAGQFTKIGGQARSNIAALDATSALATEWNPGANGEVTGLALSNGNVYVIGRFTSIGGQPRDGIAAIRPTDAIFHNGFD